LIERNPFASKRLEVHTEKGTHHKPLPMEIVQAIMLGIQDLPDNERRMMALLCYSGQRVGEILGLRWEDIDFDRSIIQVQRGVTHPTRNQPEIGQTKTKASNRDISMNQALIEALKPYEETGFIIGGNQPMTFQQDKRLWAKLRKRFHLEGYSRHDFRDTCGTIWYEEGIPMLTIQALLGHENMNTTAKYYTKVREISLQEAKKIMDANC
jgi:integrase